MSRARVQLMISEEQDEWLDKMKNDNSNLDRSFLVRRALKYYMEEGMNRDKMLKRKIKGEI